MPLGNPTDGTCLPLLCPGVQVAYWYGCLTSIQVLTWIPGWNLCVCVCVCVFLTSQNIIIIHECLLSPVLSNTRPMQLWCSVHVQPHFRRHASNLYMHKYCSKPEGLGLWAARSDRLVPSWNMSGDSLGNATVHKTRLPTHWWAQEGGIAGVERQRKANLAQVGRCTCGNEKYITGISDCQKIW